MTAIQHKPRRSSDKAPASHPRRRRSAKLPQPNRLIARARRKFVRAFPGGFRDETYVDWERDYKWRAHLRWQEDLSEVSFRRLIANRQFGEAARLASSIESRTNLLFSFEKMALRDAIRSPAGAQAFACVLFDFLHGGEQPEIRFASWIAALDMLPRRQTRVLPSRSPPSLALSPNQGSISFSNPTRRAKLCDAAEYHSITTRVRPGQSTRLCARASYAWLERRIIRSKLVPH